MKSDEHALEFKLQMRDYGQDLVPKPGVDNVIEKDVKEYEPLAYHRVIADRQNSDQSILAWVTLEQNPILGYVYVCWLITLSIYCLSILIYNK